MEDIVLYTYNIIGNICFNPNTTTNTGSQYSYIMLQNLQNTKTKKI